MKYLVLFSYPATFYLFVSYSEALYIALLLLGVYWLRDVESGKGKSIPASIDLLVLALIGYNLGLTRLTGFLIPGFLFLNAAISYYRNRTETNRRDVVRTVFFLGFSGVGIGSFFLYCATKFGAWNLYFQQLALGWYKEFSPLKAFNLYFHPVFEIPFEIEHFVSYPKVTSWLMVVAFTAIFVWVWIRKSWKSTEAVINRFDTALLFGASAHFAITVCGDVGPWDHWSNGMRYSLPPLFLVTYLFRREWLPALITSSVCIRRVSLVLFTLVLITLFYLQMGYLIRFTRIEWVS